MYTKFYLEHCSHTSFLNCMYIIYIYHNYSEFFNYQDVNKARPGTFSKPRSALQEDKNLGGNVGRSQPGNKISSSDVTTATTQRANAKESSSTGFISKRNSKLNIPAAFLADKQEPAMNRPPVVPKKTVSTPVEENKLGVTPKPALKPKVPMDKESSVATILRTINNAQSNLSHENGDVSNTESETVKKPINPFLALDREKKVESSTNKPPITPVKPVSRSDSDKPVPPWKMPKPVESDKPTPPWKVPKPDTGSEKPVPPWKARASQEQDSENKSENVPPWKAKKFPVDTNNVSEEKPVPLWKQKNLQNKPETLNKPEANKSDSFPTPSWKANTEPLAKDGNKQPPSKLKSPFLANKSELNAVIGKLHRTSSASSDEPPPVHRSLKQKNSIKRKSLTRTFDQKKFFAVDLQTVEVDNNPPLKPAKMLGAVNIDIIIERYKARLAPSSGMAKNKTKNRQNTNILHVLKIIFFLHLAGILEKRNQILL